MVSCLKKIETKKKILNTKIMKESYFSNEKWWAHHEMCVHFINASCVVDQFGDGWVERKIEKYLKIEKSEHSIFHQRETVEQAQNFHNFLWISCFFYIKLHSSVLIYEMERQQMIKNESNKIEETSQIYLTFS